MPALDEFTTVRRSNACFGRVSKHQALVQPSTELITHHLQPSKGNILFIQRQATTATAKAIILAGKAPEMLF